MRSDPATSARSPPAIPVKSHWTSTAPGEESGTYDSYVGFVVADLAEERGADEATRPDYTALGR